MRAQSCPDDTLHRSAATKSHAPSSTQRAATCHIGTWYVVISLRKRAPTSEISGAGFVKACSEISIERAILSTSRSSSRVHRTCRSGGVNSRLKNTVCAISCARLNLASNGWIFRLRVAIRPLRSARKWACPVEPGAASCHTMRTIRRDSATRSSALVETHSSSVFLATWRRSATARSIALDTLSASNVRIRNAAAAPVTYSSLGVTSPASESSVCPCFARFRRLRTVVFPVDTRC